MQHLHPVRRALLSVSDKTGIVEFAQALAQRGIALLSTGGTARLLADAGLTVTEISDYTGFPEMMDGRIKTLHPRVHGGILGRRGQDDDIMQQHDIAEIDMVVVNLYPFARTVARPDCTPEEAIENIDIGGPAMVRSAAKNHRYVAVVTESADYAPLLAELDAHQNQLTSATRFKLAARAFRHTACYDDTIARYLNVQLAGSHHEQESVSEQFPATLNLRFNKIMTLRYGENSHQQAAFYGDQHTTDASIATARQLQGKTLSYNNIADADTALECVKMFTQPTCVIVKHANPCGVGSGKTLRDAYERAWKTDPTSAFGGIIAFNQPLDEQTAQCLVERQFVEVIIAPSISEAALRITAKKQNIRVLTCTPWHAPSPSFDFKRVNGGLLVQERDEACVTPNSLRVVTKRQPTPDEWNDAIFSWKVAQFVKSNAIVLAHDGMTLGIGAGQMSRIWSAKLAGMKAREAGLATEGAVMASDAFFPFRDGVDAAAAMGVRCIIQPGGSIRDEEVIAAADEHHMAMLFTDIRHFRH